MRPDPTRAEALAKLEELAKLNPTKRFAVSANNDHVGYFCDERKRFVPVVSYAISGNWIFLGPHGLEILVNGERPPREWVEVMGPIEPVQAVPCA
jgi:hypothetical protein